MEFDQIKAVIPKFAGFYSHKWYNKMRLREKHLLTKRHQCTGSMELGSKNRKRTKLGNFEVKQNQRRFSNDWNLGLPQWIDQKECRRFKVCNFPIAQKIHQFKATWTFYAFTQLAWWSWEANFLSEKYREVLKIDQVNAFTPMLAAFDFHKRYNKTKLRKLFLLTKRHQDFGLIELGVMSVCLPVKMCFWDRQLTYLVRDVLPSLIIYIRYM